MSAKINIRIDEEGNCHFDVTGAPGTSCESLTELLMRGLGEVEEQHHTEEYEQILPDYLTVEE